MCPGDDRSGVMGYEQGLGDPRRPWDADSFPHAPTRSLSLTAVRVLSNGHRAAASSSHR